MPAGSCGASRSPWRARSSRWTTGSARYLRQSPGRRWLQHRRRRSYHRAGRYLAVDGLLAGRVTPRLARRDGSAAHAGLSRAGCWVRPCPGSARDDCPRPSPRVLRMAGWPSTASAADHDLILVSSGSRKTLVVKAIITLTGMRLKEAEHLVDSAPRWSCAKSRASGPTGQRNGWKAWARPSLSAATDRHHLGITEARASSNLPGWSARSPRRVIRQRPAGHDHQEPSFLSAMSGQWGDTAPVNRFLERLAGVAARKHWLFIVIWVVVLGGLLGRQACARRRVRQQLHDLRQRLRDRP